MILLLLSFIAGILTVLAPCTLALLPVIVGGTLSGERSMRRAFTVTAALGVSVILFTLILKVSTAFINVPQSFWEILSGVIIFGLGLTMIFPKLLDKIPFLSMINRDSSKLVSAGYQKQNFVGDILIGVSLGPVFSSCSPTYFLILATILPASIALGVVYLLVYTVGLCGTLLLISVAGQKLLEKFNIASDPNGWLKKTIGVIFLALGVLIMTGWETQLETALTNSGYFDVTQIEQNLLQKTSNSQPVQNTFATSTSAITATSSQAYAAQLLAYDEAHYQKAPEIADPSGFINTGGLPISISQFKGKKAVLIDFWTYSCINCQRTEPYMKAWYTKYSDQGLEIISIHTPEFSFEKVQSNVQNAVNGFGIKYPVVMDNNYGTWNAFGNEYWPNKYLIDVNGYIVYNHAGEGNYDVTEEAIQKALKERDAALGLPDTVPSGIVNPSDAVSMDLNGVQSPETYFGANRNEYLANGNVGATGMQTLTVPSSINMNSLYLGGAWNFQPEYAQAATGSEITYEYSAKNLYFVAASEDPNGTQIKITVDGKAPGAMAGADVSADGTATIKEDRLYKLLQGTSYGTHTIKIEAEGSGLDAYTFTFG